MTGEGALSGLVVLDLTRVLAGPFCTMMLADMGATVIKIEQPGVGDDTRGFYPFNKKGISTYYLNLNRNKKGITLDLKKGKDVFLELVRKADIVIENYRPGTMEKLGLGYEELAKVNPRLVYGEVSGYGATGPYAMRPGYDILAQAMGGMMSLTGWPDRPPTACCGSIGDILGGLSVCIGILAALDCARRTGRGQKVDVALTDAVFASTVITSQIFLTEGRIPTRIGNRYENNYPYDTFATADGTVALAAGNNKLWQLCCGVIGRPECADDERYNSIGKRAKAHEEVRDMVEAWSRRHSTDEVVEGFVSAGVPCAPIQNIAQVAADPHIAGARQMVVEVDDPVSGPTRMTGCHIKLSATPPSVRAPAPTLGQDNMEIFGDFLGYGHDRLEQMRQDGMI